MSLLFKAIGVLFDRDNDDKEPIEAIVWGTTPEGLSDAVIEAAHETDTNAFAGAVGTVDTDDNKG